MIGIAGAEIVRRITSGDPLDLEAIQDILKRPCNASCM